MFQPTAAGGGQILRTSNGGVSWTAVQGNGFARPAGFNNWVHMFDANVGVFFGDPNTGPGSAFPYFEMLRTIDGGLIWTRIPAGSLSAPAPAPAAEGGPDALVLRVARHQHYLNQHYPAAARRPVSHPQID